GQYRPGLPLATAAEREYLMDDRLRAFPRRHDLAHVPLRAAAAGQARQRQFGVAEDSRPAVVGLVCNSASERAGGFEAVGLTQPSLQHRALRFATLALDGIGKDFPRRAQQRNIVVGPMLSRRNGIERKEAHALAGAPHRYAQP